MKKVSSNHDEAPKTYLQIRQMIYEGHLDLAAQRLSGMLDLDDLWIKILNTRLSLKSSAVSRHLLIESFPLSSSSYLAEAHFSNGLVYFYLEEPQAGALEFSQAAYHYQILEDSDRYLLSLFNEAIGVENADVASDPVERVQRFMNIKRLAFEKQNHRIFALTTRQLGMLHHQIGHLLAAQDELERSLEFTELYCGSSDLHSVLLALALVHCEQNNLIATQLCFEKILGRVEARNKLAWDYVAWKIKLRRAEPVLGDYTVHCPHTLRVLQGKVSAGSAVALFTKQEKLLYDLIEQGQASKEYLCLSLWPELSLAAIKENRLHVLLKRLKNKLLSSGQKINFKNGFYTLQS